jgi:hypothetical protein
MEKIALILSFEYSSASYLPGAIVDLFRIYSMIRDKGYDKITIITDCNPTDRILYDYTTMNTDVDVEIYSVRTLLTMYKNKDQVLTLLHEVLTCKKGFLYYSGHSMSKKIILPDCNISDYDILDIISGVKDPNVESMLIFDCCNGTNFLLPYLHDGIMYHLVDNARVYMPHRVILICSSIGNQQSFSDISGSDLTKSLVKNISKLSIRDIMRSVILDVTSVSKSSPTLYSTYPNIHYIFPWVIYGTKLTILIDKYNNDVKVL